MTLFVRDSSDDVTEWNRQRIVDALITEAQLNNAVAEEISLDVEKQLVASGLSLLTSSLVRELVNAKLVERGLLAARKKHMRIGFPLYDVRQLLVLENKGNANVPHSPEGTNLIIAEGIKREYAVNDVFSQAVTDAHISGDIHLHGLGHIDRLYSALLSVEYIKKYGLTFPNTINSANPAKHAETLLLHLMRFSVIMQGHLGGHIGWDALNISFAPYITGLTDKEVKQIAQMLIYEFSQLASGRGGQSIFCDIHLYWNVPPHLKGGIAIIAGGIASDKTYADYKFEAQRFFKALFEVYLEGDAMGKPFIFPRPVVHIDNAMLSAQDKATKNALALICDVASLKGNPSFLFERKGHTPKFEITTNNAKARIFAAHSVSLNLPRLGLRAQKDTKQLFKLIDDCLKLAIKAHQQKRDFIDVIFLREEKSPLAFLKMEYDSEPYFRLDDAFFLIGLVGLNELVAFHGGETLAVSVKAREMGLKIVKHIYDTATKLGKENGIKMMLTQSHAETTAHRFARLDLKSFSPMAGRCVKGNLITGGVYYTNSSHMAVSANISPLEKVAYEGAFHPFIGAETASQIYLGKPFTACNAMVDFIRNVFAQTECHQLLFSPEFSICSDCGALTAHDAIVCSSCGARNIDMIARITHYYSLTSAWNKGKLSELVDRKRHNSFFVQE